MKKICGTCWLIRLRSVGRIFDEASVTIRVTTVVSHCHWSCEMEFATYITIVSLTTLAGKRFYHMQSEFLTCFGATFSQECCVMRHSLLLPRSFIFFLQLHDHVVEVLEFELLLRIALPDCHVSRISYDKRLLLPCEVVL